MPRSRSLNQSQKQKRRRNRDIINLERNSDALRFHSNFKQIFFSPPPHLEAHREGEGQGDEDEAPGDGGEEPTAQADAGLRLVRWKCEKN